MVAKVQLAGSSLVLWQPLRGYAWREAVTIPSAWGEDVQPALDYRSWRFPFNSCVFMQSLIDCAHHRCCGPTSWANRRRRSDNIADEPGRMPVPDGHSGVTASCSRDCIANKREPPDHTRPGFSRIHQGRGGIRSRTAAECPDFLPKLALR